MTWESITLDKQYDKAREVRQIIKEKVNGKITPLHDDLGHHYRFNNTGTIVDSVTTKNILDKPHLLHWAVKMGFEWMERDDRWMTLQESPDIRDEMLKGCQLAYRDVRDDAGNLGTEAHDCIERYLLKWIEDEKQPDDIRTFLNQDYRKTDRRVVSCIRAAERAITKHKVIPVAAELIVGLESYGSAGMVDALFVNPKGKLEMWDWKTSNQMNDYYAIQLSVYKTFFEGMTGLKLESCKIPHLLKRKGGFHVFNVLNARSHVATFKRISYIYDRYWVDKGSNFREDLKTLKLK